MPVPTAVAARRQFKDSGEGMLRALDRQLDLPGVAAELLAERIGVASGEVGAADLDDVRPTRGPCPRALVQALQRGVKSLAMAWPTATWIAVGKHVVGRLPHVDVVVGMDRPSWRRSGRLWSTRWRDC